eukprot:443936-Rhodomonas_salina.1
MVTEFGSQGFGGGGGERAQLAASQDIGGQVAVQDRAYCHVAAARSTGIVANSLQTENLTNCLGGAWFSFEFVFCGLLSCHGGCYNITLPLLTPPISSSSSPLLPLVAGTQLNQDSWRRALLARRWAGMGRGASGSAAEQREAVYSAMHGRAGARVSALHFVCTLSQL